MAITNVNLCLTLFEVEHYHIVHGFNKRWHLSQAQEPPLVPLTSLKHVLHAMFIVVAFF